MPARLTSAQLRAADDLGKAFAAFLVATIEASQPVEVVPVRPQPAATPEGFLGYPEAAQRIGVGETKLRELIGEGRLERVHIGRRALITSASVDAYVASVAGRAVPDSNIRRLSARGDRRAVAKKQKAARGV